MISGSTEVGVGDTKSQEEEAERHQEVEAERHQEVGEARHQKLAAQEQHPGEAVARHQ